MIQPRHTDPNGNGEENPAKKYWINGRLRKLPPLNKAVSRPVDVRHDPRDFMVCLLAGTMYSNECIRRVTGFSDGQIGYRLKKGHVDRKAARDGKTVIAKRMLNQIVTNVAPIMQRQLPKQIEAAN